MKPYRHTFDQNVIDAWAAHVAERSRGVGRLVLPTFIGAISLIATAVFVKLSPWLVLPGMGLGVLSVALGVVHHASFRCPHCHQHPIGSGARGWPEAADFCKHCYYWLRSPYDNRGNDRA